MPVGGIEWRVAAPAPRLRPYVRSYVGYRMDGLDPRLHRGLPSRYPTWIVSIGAPIEVVAQTDPTQAPASYRAVLSGLQASPALIAEPGHGAGVAIELAPLGLRAMLGIPAAALWNTSCELADVVGGWGDELWERLQTAPTWPARFAVCDEVLGRMAGDHSVDPTLAHAWAALDRADGSLPVDVLARRVGWTRQHLGARFRSEYGVGPKVVARVMRFERARWMLQSPARPTIAQVAARSGYFDQAHLHRDFVAFAGCSPRTWMAEENLPFVQDDDHHVDAGWRP